MDYNQVILESGLKKIYIAAQLEISPSMLSLFIKGERNLSPERLKKLHKILKLN